MRSVLAVLGAVAMGCGAPVVTSDAGADARGGDAIAATDATRDAAGECFPLGSDDGLAYAEGATGQRESRFAVFVFCVVEGTDVLVCHDEDDQGQPRGFEVRMRFPGGWRVPARGMPYEHGSEFSITRVTPWGRPADDGPWEGFAVIGNSGPDASGNPTPTSLTGYACGARYTVQFRTLIEVR
jgi:hypothetical protein